LEGVLFGLKKMFGRKAIEANAPMASTRIPNPTDADGVSRVFSDTLWDDPERAKFLTEMGYTPNMQSNIVETVEDRQALVKQSAMRGIKRQFALEADLSSQFGSVSLMTFVLIRDEIWTRDADGDWLQDMMDYDLYAEWNTIFLPNDLNTARNMELPIHTQVHLPTIYGILDHTISDFVKSLRAQYGNFPSPDQRVQIRKYVSEEVEMMKPVVIQVMANLNGDAGLKTTH
jgi:hypothetical protein